MSVTVTSSHPSWGAKEQRRNIPPVPVITRERRRTQSVRAATAVALLLACACASPPACLASDPATLNGGSALAMAGDGCVALAVDRRFGSGGQTVAVASSRRVLVFGGRAMAGFAGLESDCQGIAEDLAARVADLTGRGDAPLSGIDPGISPRSLSVLTSNVLYSRRSSPFYAEPLIVGLEEPPPGRSGKGFRAFLCSQDVLGAQMIVDDFVCCGAASTSLYGAAQDAWRPGMGAEELARVCGRAFMAAIERDCLSGYGAVVYVMTEEQIIANELQFRND
mmetsp:Transcript_19676/g.39134  ORF Transcript_19676/g.39134 Transcript_19676/m.39134 type:complete len:280 (-) Transcript_19676:244-1083(-)